MRPRILSFVKTAQGFWSVQYDAATQVGIVRQDASTKLTCFGITSSSVLYAQWLEEIAEFMREKEKQ